MTSPGEFQEMTRSLKRDMSEKWAELLKTVTKYENLLKDASRPEGEEESAEMVRLRIDNEELRLKYRALEGKWKTFKDDCIRKEVVLEKKLQTLTASNKRLKDAINKLKQNNPPPQKKRRVENGMGDNEGEDSNGSSVSNNAKDEIIPGFRKRKPAFSHLKEEYAIDMKGMDQKMLDKDEDIAGVAGEDAGEMDEHDPDTYCPECNKQFVAASRLQLHLRNIHGVLNPGNNFSCEKCDLTLGSVVAYNRHMKFLHGLDEKMFTCDVCKVSFATLENLQSHIDNKVHDKKTAVDQALEPGETIIVLQPPKKQNANKRNICPLCFMVFPTTSEMQAHMVKHRRPKAGSVTTYTCDGCEEVFYKKSALTDHLTRCPRLEDEKTEDEKLWESIQFPEPCEILREQLNYQDESLIDPESGPTADYQEPIPGTAAVSQNIEAVTTVLHPQRNIVTKSLLADKCPTGAQTQTIIMETDEASGEAGMETIIIQDAALKQAPQYETVSIVNEDGQPLGQAQVSVDPDSGQVTYMAVSETGEQIPLSQIMGEGTDPSELLLSILNAKNT